MVSKGQRVFPEAAPEGCAEMEKRREGPPGSAAPEYRVPRNQFSLFSHIASSCLGVRGGVGAI